ncbi:hypothetical protein [Labedaea rhizosphaerae]|uniref:Uncharacterized protein n=1 Tax=Labedaea rhizosphaerae TaxID=598644 RepID=A0A4R6S0Y4_LABRH|nr:hypothetical protein [Labedaea rhizosphaerae]TDP92864.1 hypothetical protein EV186_10779 [Labedaea rhizosphaerae]
MERPEKVDDVRDLRWKVKTTVVGVALLAVTGAGVVTATNLEATASAAPYPDALCVVIPPLPLPPDVNPCDMHW